MPGHYHLDLSAFFRWVYCLPPAALALGLMICTLVLCLLHRRMRRLRWWRWGLSSALVLWLALVLWTTVLNRLPGSSAEVRLIPFHSIAAAFADGKRELLRSCFMNAALFFPAGVLFSFCAPRTWTSRRRLLTLVAAFFLCSLAIELAQYRWGLGSAETDDVINNTLGAALGYAAAAWGQKRI